MSPHYHLPWTNADAIMLGSFQDVYVAVMGVTGAGKSTFIEKLTGEEVNVIHGLVSCKYF